METTSADHVDAQTYAIIGAAMEVHRALGAGFLEGVYQEALAIEFATRAIPHKCQAPLKIFYRGTELTTHYKADFVCHDHIIVELKAQTRLTSADQAQVVNYLKASRLDRGLLLNFGTSSLEHKRLLPPPSNPLHSVF